MRRLFHRTLSGATERWRRLRRWQRALLLVFAAILISMAGFYGWLVSDLPAIDRLQAGLARPSTRILDRNGRLLYEIIDPKGGHNVTLGRDQVPAALVQATIATEDKTFYSNSGVDPGGIVRALWQNVRGGDIRSGGSTITQQVARNLLLDPAERTERTLTRKLREAILALQLGGRYTRDEILMVYLNQTFYGNLAYGVQSAAQVYFGKDAAALDLAESALIAGLPQSPALYDPLTNPTAAKDRQKTVLRLMLDTGAITQDQADEAARQPLQYAHNRIAIEAPHFVTMVWDQLAAQYPAALAQGGLTVRTTLDLDWQHAAEQIAAQNIYTLNHPPPGEPPHNASNAALVAIDPHNGQVLTLVGSVDFFDGAIGGAINMAMAPRQPGSALKPFTYALAFDPAKPNAWAPATMLLDVSTPFITRRLESYTPANYGLVEHGPTSIREALASSYNIPAVVTLDHVGVPALIDLLHRLGVASLADRERYDLSLTLGGGEVRLLELTAAYGAFANEGRPIAPALLLNVQDQAGRVLYDWEAPPPRSPVFDPRVAYLITDILSDTEARLPSFGNHSALEIARPAAAKTGTTTDFRDNWTVGYTPGLVVGVWVGNADNRPMIKVSGVSGAGPIWNNFMRAALAAIPDQNFTIPPGVHQAEVCALSGLLPTPLCPRTRYDWFIDGTAPTQTDNIYQKIEIDRATGLLATADTPPDRRDERVYTVLPPEARAWAIRRGIPQPPQDGIRSAVKPGGAIDGVQLLSPDPYTIFQLSPLTPYDAQQIKFSAAAPSGTRRISYELNGDPVGSIDAAPYTVWWPLRFGTYQLVAIATLADGSTRRSPALPFSVTSYAAPDTRPASGAAGQ